MKRFYLFLIPVLFSSCGEDLQEYYFDYEDFKSPKYYYFKCQEDPSASVYWKMKYNEKNGLFVTEGFNSKLDRVDLFTEKKDEQGAKLVEYTMMNDSTPIYTVPLDRNVYLWDDNDDTYSYAVEYSYEGSKVTFRKTRQFLDKEDVMIMGEKLEALKYKSIFRHVAIGTGDSYEFWQFGYYTKEHGFVKYERHLPSGETLTYELVKIFSEKEWKELVKSSRK